jgi:hypothetical protein
MAKAKAKKASKGKARVSNGALPAKQAQSDFPGALKASPGKCRVCGVAVGPKATLCGTHRALLARKRDRALFLAIKATDAGKDLIDRVTKKGVLEHLGL